MDKWAQACQAAESVLEENLTQVNRITLWLTGGAVLDNKGAPDHMSINANVVDHQNETIKIRYDVPEDMLNELDTEKAVMGYAVEVIINHIVLEKYFDKFN